MKRIDALIPDTTSLGGYKIDHDHDVLGDPAKVKLVSFTAEPDRIAPFGSAVISWEIEDNNSRCSFLLNGVTVPAMGSMRVSPLVTFPYYLKASTGLHLVDLGKVEVAVDLGTCSFDENTYANQAIMSYFQLLLPSIEPRLRLRTVQGARVVANTGNFHFEFDLDYPANNLPNPRVDIRGDLGLAVMQDGPMLSRRRMYGYFRNLSVEAYYTWHQWAAVALLGPTAAVATAQVISSAEQYAREMMDPMFDRIIAMPLIAGTPPVGMGIQNVAIAPGAQGMGTIRRTWCPTTGPIAPRPQDPLRKP